MLYACIAKPSLRFLALIGIVGVGGAISEKFFHILPDYTFRLNPFSAVSYIVRTIIGYNYFVNVEIWREKIVAVTGKELLFFDINDIEQATRRF